MKLELATVPIEVRAFESIEEEIRFLLSKNATRTKTVFQKVREGQQWQEIESDLAKERMKTAQSDRTNLTGVENFPHADEKGKTRDIIARRVGLGSGRNYQKALQVVEFIDRLCESEKTEIAEALKRILNESSINAAHKVLSMTDKERERILELIASNKALTIKEAQKILKDQNPPPKTEVLAEGMRILVDRASPICPGLKGEITSLPNSSSAIVLFEDGTRQMVDRGYIKPALEDLPQSLIERSTRVSSPTTPTTQSQTTEKTQSQTTSFDEPKSAKEKLDKKQEELGLGKRRQSILPESDRILRNSSRINRKRSDRQYRGCPTPTSQSIYCSQSVELLDKNALD